jgi:carboxyl-terminal processing protease
VSSRAARIAYLLVSPAVFLGALLLARRHLDAPGEPTLHWDDALRRQVQAVVETRYVDPLDEERSRRLFDAALQGYVGALDPFSSYVPPDEKERVEQELQGVLGGIGVRAAPVPGGIRVTAVREGAPADRAGIAPADVIESVGGQAVSGRDFEQMVALIRGAPGSRIELVVAREGVRRTVEVERAEVPVDTVPSVRLLSGSPAVGYVRIEQFSDGTPDDARAAFDRLRADGAQALVLDLRQNLGGSVSAAVKVAALFVESGATVCVVRRREGGDVHRARPVDGAPPSGLPLAVLVDESTASASEILAGALQDHGRAVLVGGRTWGKFLTQTLVETEGGAIVKLTTGRHETPRGRSAPRREDDDPAGGLVPDVRVATTPQERRALYDEFGRQTGLSWRTLPRDGADPADPALRTALDLLRGGRPPAEKVASRR